MKSFFSKIKKKIITFALFLGLVGLVAAPGILYPRPAYAFVDINQAIKNVIDTIWRTLDKIDMSIRSALKTSAAVAWKNALRAFANRLAYRTAIYFASGGRGQKPLYWTKPLKWIQEGADAAAGEYLETVFTYGSGERYCSLTKEMCSAGTPCPPGVCLPHPEREGTFCAVIREEAGGEYEFTNKPCVSHEDCRNECSVPGTPLGISLCEASPALRLEFALSIATDIGLKEYQPPRCTLTQIYRNFRKARTHSESIEAFKELFKEGNQLADYLNLLSRTIEIKEREEGRREKETEKQIKDIKSIISGDIKTPSIFLTETFNISLREALKAEETYTGEILADAIGVFTNTLISKLLEKTFEEGFNPEADVAAVVQQTEVSRGVVAAKEKFLSLTQAGLNVGGKINILTELASCPTENPTPRNCVIDEKFRMAIEEGLTVKEAIKRNLIDSHKPFAFGPQGENLKYNQGYPYRSIMILRKYRIVPVGWELAAKYIRDNPGNYTIADLIRGFNDCNVDGEPDQDHPFCKLVDPEWVLKAPEVFCKRKGFTSQIVTQEWIDQIKETTDPTTGEVNIEKLPKKKLVSREEGCVDEQTCLKENPDGSCLAYGYCFEERPTFKLEGTECKPEYESCQIFIDSQGQKLSYLKSSLYLDECDAQSAGCMWYCKDYNENADRFECYYDLSGPVSVDGETTNYPNYPQNHPLGTDQLAFLNNQAKACSEFAEGCREFIQINNGGFKRYNGTNLLPNGSFEHINQDPNTGEFESFKGWDDIGVSGYLEEENVLNGSYAFRNTDPTDTNPSFTGLILQKTVDFGVPLKTHSFVLSGKGYSQADSCSGTIRIQSTTESDQQNFTLDEGNWSSFELVYEFTNETDSQFQVQVELSSGCDVILDTLKLEEGEEPTSYTDYGSNNLIYLNKNRRECSVEEVGCELYTSQTFGSQVPGIISEDNFCPEEYVGCRPYQLMALTNNPPDPTFSERQGYPSNPIDISFVANTAEQCPAQYVGCEEYTNLDIVAQGGEGKEYYTYIRPCAKPGVGDQITYYSWTWSGGGYQLQAFTLIKSDVDNGPCNNAHPSQQGVCQDSVYGAVDCSSEFGVNPDCREYFYVSPSGVEVFYRYQSRTITVSDDCHPLRNTLDGNTYYSIPSESQACPAQYVGCRQFRGPESYNTYQVISDDFDDGTYQGWYGGDISSNSVWVGGYSYYVTAGMVGPPIAYKDLIDMINGHTSYVLKLWAQGDGTSSNLKAYLVVGSNTYQFNPLSGIDIDANNWNIYTFGPILIDEDIPSGTFVRLIITGTSNFFMDNVVLEEATGSLYLIKDSYQVCSGYEYCDAWQDRQGNTYYLTGFEKLCSSDKVGCQVLIDTQNTSSPYEVTYGSNDDQNEITFPADEIVYLVNDSNNYCSAEEKGCRRLGKPKIKSGHLQESYLIGYDTVFLVDNPDEYENIWCKPSQEFCAEYTVADTASKMYFKAPQDRVCEYKKDSITGSWGWYIKDTDTLCPWLDLKNRPASGICRDVSSGDYTNKICQKDSDCSSGEECVQGYVGLCPAEQSGCNLYLEPSGLNFPNLINNNGFEKGKEDDSITIDFWREDTPGEAVFQWADEGRSGKAIKVRYLTPSADEGRIIQEITLEPYRYYEISAWVKKGDANEPARIVVDNCKNTEGRIIGADYCAEWNNSSERYEWTDKICSGPYALSCDTNYDHEGICQKAGSPLFCQNKNTWQWTDEMCNDDNYCNDLFGTTDEYRCAPRPQLQIGLSSPDGSMVLNSDHTSPPDQPPYDEANVFLSVDRLDPNEYIRFSGIFYSGDAVSCEISIGANHASQDKGHWFDEVELKQLGDYYYLNQTVSQGDCNGRVNLEEGCIVFNDLSKGTVSMNSYDTYRLEKEQGKNIVPQSCSLDPSAVSSGERVEINEGDTSYTCDGNSVIKARRDRECAKWLYCNSQIKVQNPQTQQEENICTSLGVCSRLGPEGQCLAFSEQLNYSQQYNMTFNTESFIPGPALSIDALKNVSGSIITGLKWSDSYKIEGFYPWAGMKEVGEDGAQDLVFNGSFDDSYGDTWLNPYPQTGSQTRYDSCTESGGPDNCPFWQPRWNAKLTLIESKDDGSLELGPEGAAKVGGKATILGTDDNNVLLIEAFEKWAGANLELQRAIKHYGKYALSFRARSASGNPVRIKTALLIRDESSSPPLACVTSPGITKVNCQNFSADYITLTSDWQSFNFYMDGFLKDFSPSDSDIVDPNTSYLVFATGEDNGANFVIDDVSLKPILEVQDKDGDYSSYDPEDKNYITRSCRAYPKEDSLMCTYTDPESGVKYLGWEGYCLEKDPENPSVCLSWWPVDAILGSSMSLWNEISPAGYTGRYPLYYCLVAKGNYGEENFGDWETNIPDSSNFTPEYENHTIHTPPYSHGEIKNDGSDAYNEQRSDNLIGKPHYYRRAVMTYMTGRLVSEGGCGNIFNKCENGVWGPCGCDRDNDNEDNQPIADGTFEASQADSMFHEYEIEKIEWTVEMRSHDDWPELGTKFITNKENNWTVCGKFGTKNYSIEQGSDCEYPSDPSWIREEGEEGYDNFFYIRVNFDDNDKHLSSYTVYMRDWSPDYGGMWVSGTMYLREPCYAVAQVVNPSGKNRAWSAKVNDSNYRLESSSDSSVNDILYYKEQRRNPYGSVLAPLGSPPDWDSRSQEEGIQPLYIEDTEYEQNFTAHAGSAYACKLYINAWPSHYIFTNCKGRMCLGGNKEGTACNSSDNCSDGNGDGICIGLGDANPPLDGTGGGVSLIFDGMFSSIDEYISRAAERLKMLFTKHYGIWKWDENNMQYVEYESHSLSIDWTPTTQCSNNTRLAPNIYCYVKPEVKNIKVNGGTGNLKYSPGITIKLTFNTKVDPEQLPLNNIEIDWGDNTPNTQVEWGGASKEDEDDPFMFFHTYTLPGIYVPKIKIEDNWEKLSEWTEFSGTITIQ